MSKGFWDKLEKPIMALAPMANVTDAAFRQMIAKYGKPDVFWTEFVSADGLVSKGQEKLLVDLWFGKNEHPIVAQIFGANPENFYKAAKLIKKLGFDGIDINMGCPDRAVVRQGAGGALIKNPKLAQEIILAAREGAGRLPVSVKTRIGFNKIVVDEWFPFLAGQGLAAIIVHLRTVKEMSEAPAHWDLMPEIVRIVKSNRIVTISSAARNRSREGSLTSFEMDHSPCPLILGNGDVMSLKEAEEKAKETGADGIMIGRGIFGNPWLFSSSPRIGEVRRGRDKTSRSTTPSPSYSRRGIPTVTERLQAMLEHTKLFEKKFKDVKNFEVMKKHFKAYVVGFNGAKELRIKLMATKNAKEVEALVHKFVT